MLCDSHLRSKLANLLLDASLLDLARNLGNLVLLALGLPLLLGLLGAFLLILLEGVLANGLVGVGVDLLEVASVNVVVEVLLELGVVALLIVVGQSLHVLGDVATEDVLAQDLGVELLGLNVVTGEAVLGVRDVDTAVGGTLHGTEDTGTGGGAGKTDIEVGLEGAAGALVGLDGLGEGVLTIGLLDTLELLVQTQLLQGAAGEQQTGGVSGGPVGQTVLDAIALELVRVGGGQDLVTGDLRVHDLGDDVAVGEAHHHTVLGSTIFVLGLVHEALAGIVVGLALPAALVLGLVAAVHKKSVNCFDEYRENPNSSRLPVVRAVLDELGERLQEKPPSQQFALQKSSLRSILQRPVLLFLSTGQCLRRGEECEDNAGLHIIDMPWH